MFSACSHVIAPTRQIPVKMEVVGPIDTSKEIYIVNGITESKLTLVGVIELEKYFVDFELWTDFIVDQLESELQKRGVKVNASPAISANRVVIGVLDIEASGTEENPHEVKQAIIGEMRQKPRVRLVDIHEACSLSDLKKNGYEKAERYKNNYQLDMILHVDQVGSTYYFSLIDLYAKKVKEVSIEAEGVSVENRFRGISNKVLTTAELRRTLRSKKKVLGIKEVEIEPEGEDVFKVSVQDVRFFQGAWATRCIVDVLVEKGDGTWSKTYEGNNASPVSVERAADGAVYRVVEAIIADRGFRKAISR